MEQQAEEATDGQIPAENEEVSKISRVTGFSCALFLKAVNAVDYGILIKRLEDEQDQVKKAWDEKEKERQKVQKEVQEERLLLEAAIALTKAPAAATPEDIQEIKDGAHDGRLSRDMQITATARKLADLARKFFTISFH